MKKNHKTIRTVKTFIVFMIVSVLQISASTYSQTTLLTLNLKDASIEQVFEKIESQSEFSFFYKNNELDVTQKVTVVAKEKTLDVVLDQLLTGKELSYLIKNRHVVIYRNEKEVPSNVEVKKQSDGNIVINGTVLDSDKEPMPGTTVLVKGTKAATFTDMDGRFKISIPGNDAVLQVSFLGYVTQEIKVGTQRNLIIELAEDAVALDEIVVTGVVGGTSKRKLGFSIEKLSSHSLDKVPADNAASALQGKLAGVKITKPSGEPGSGYNIQLRAAKTISSGSEPLVIVDGVLGGDMNISADDIASIEVLKGAAASSLYGSRAANGVINIMTKRGSAMDKGKVQVDYRTEYGQSFLDYVPAQSKSTNRIIDNGTVTTTTDADQVYDNPYPKTYDHVSQFFNPGAFWTNYLALRGNSSDGKISIYTSLQTTKEAGIVKLVNGADRNNIKLNLDYKISDKFRFTTSNFYSQFTSDNVSSSIFGALLRSDPNADLELPNADGTPYLVNVNKLTDGVVNPLYTVNNTRNERKYETLQSFFGFKYDLLSNLMLDLSYSTIRSNGTTFYMTPKGMLRYDLTEDPGYISRYAWQSKDQTVTFEAGYDEKFGDFNTRFKGQFLYESGDFDDLSGSASNLALGGYSLTTLNSGSTPSASSGITETVSYNVSGIAAVDYQDKYIFDGLVRRDASSLFGPEVRWQTFFRTSGAWRVTQDFKIPGIDEWKLRASYGTAGLRPPYGAIYETYSLNAGVPGNMETLGNKQLKPSFSKELEIGTDLHFLSRFNFSFNYSDTKNTDLILKVPISPLSGAAYQWQNAAELSTHTYEATLGVNLFNQKDFGIDMAFTFDKYKQKITKLDANPYFIDGTRFRIEEGVDFGVLYLDKFAKSLDEVVNQVPAGRTVDEIFAINNQGFVVERSKIGTVDENPVKIKNNKGDIISLPSANCTPDFNLNWNTTLTIKNFTFYMLWTWQQGGDVYNHSVRYITEPAIVDQGGKPWNEVKSSTYYSNGGQNYGLLGWDNDVLVYDGSFLKLREVSLGYTLKIASWEKYIKKIRLNLIGRNLLTLTKYPGFDPEVGQNKTDASGRVQLDSNTFRFDSNERYPISRMISGSIALTF